MNSLLVKASNIKSITPLDMHGRQKLSDIGIDSSVVPHTVKSIHLLLLNKVYSGIGTENTNGGLEFFSSTLLMDLSSLKETCNTAAAVKEEAMDIGGPSIQPGETEIIANVTVTYRMK